MAAGRRLDLSQYQGRERQPHALGCYRRGLQRGIRHAHAAGQAGTGLYFSKACEPVREYLLRFVHERDVYKLLVALAWQAESSLLDRRLVYDGSEAIFEMAKVANVAINGFPAERIDEAIDLMRRHLPDLHQARLRVLER